MVYESLKKNLPELAPVAFDHAQQITRKAMQGMFANTGPNTGPKSTILDPSDAVSDELLQSILETTCVEELARNTLVLQGLQRLIQSSKEAPNLLEALSSSGAKVAEEVLSLIQDAINQASAGEGLDLQPAMTKASSLK